MKIIVFIFGKLILKQLMRKNAWLYFLFLVLVPLLVMKSKMNVTRLILVPRTWKYRLLLYTEIMPWKLRTNDFYSRVAMHQKTNEWAQRKSEFLMLGNDYIFHVMLFISYWDFFLLKAARFLPSTVKNYRSCLRLDERCIFSRSLSMYEINYGTFNVGFEDQIPY